MALLCREIVVEKGVATGVKIQQDGCPEQFIKAKRAVISGRGLTWWLCCSTLLWGAHPLVVKIYSEFPALVCLQPAALT